MHKNSAVQQAKRKKPEEIIKVLADKYRVTERYVRMVISGERTHTDIMEEYIEYRQKHNQLLNEVMKTVPFN